MSVRIVWPYSGFMKDEEVINAAKDAVANNSNFTETFSGNLEEAVVLLAEFGTITPHKDWRV